MMLSANWGALPNDVTEYIFELLVDAHFYTDPAYTWVSLRQLSSHQKRAIEHRFASFWLPKVSITLYSGARHKFEYDIDDKTWPQNFDGSDHVVFSLLHQIHNPLLGIDQYSMPGRFGRKHLQDTWAQYDPVHLRNFTVRLGEGFLSAGCRGGYLVNDTDLPGLQVLPNLQIRFSWKGAMNELLREEMYMRKTGERLFADACNEWRAENAGRLLPVSGSGPRAPPLMMQLTIWRFYVQAARRVATLKHRVAKSQTDGSCRTLMLKFAAPSMMLHKQQPIGSDLRACELARYNERCQIPDIFEVVNVEESAVPQLEIFQKWLHQSREHDGGERKEETGAVDIDTILDLYRGEYALRCETDGPEDSNDDENWPSTVDLSWPVGHVSRRDRRRGTDQDKNIQAVMVGEHKARWKLL